MNRRTFLKATGATTVLAGTVGTSWALNQKPKLPIIPLADYTGGINDKIRLNLKKAKHNFGNGAMSDTFGINSNYLGPVLKVKQGQTLPFEVNNQIGDTTTIHWHGLHIPGDVDGGPHQEIKHGESWTPNVPITQNASMNWFHSHMHGKTASQTYKGLAGVLLVEDDASLSADLPKTYGVDDFTIVLQDKQFDSSGKMHYELTGEVFDEGFLGNVMTINGAIAPVMQSVPKGLVRFRILNACNSRFLTLSMKTGSMTVIASDGGFLSKAVETDKLYMSPGERYEILLDMAKVSSNDLMVDFDPVAFWDYVFGAKKKIPVLSLERSSKQGMTASMPNKLANMDAPKPETAIRTRTFHLTNEGSADLAALAANWGNVCGDGVMGINGKPMKMDRIDEEVKLGDVEIWRIWAQEDLHPFHVHGCSFRILNQSEAPPASYAAGWKDMVHIDEAWSEILVQFNHKAPKEAPFMYHCHILEHEDCGMMGQFTVS